MPSQTATAKSIFLDAVDISAPHQRQQYLDQACEGDTGAEHVEALLDAHGVPNAMLDGGGVVATIDQPIAQATDQYVGSTIGPYTIREQLAEGGMGVVYVADQTEPVRRRVALKVIKPGMASKHVVTRFEAERQALALMDHPNIAHIFDGGATDSGQPFFAMELVQGLPITEYCDQYELTTHERLRLFSEVCRAIQHAHQKGIIHRDIKPSNVLVAEIDGAAVPKVIDFGVAKAISQKLTDQTIYTQFSQMVGTPLYMSPEQVATGTLDIDTRSDVYSLGVLLYELLTGSTPFDREKLKQAGFDEFRRIIREDEPRRPSEAVSTLQAQARSTVADRRSGDPRKLSVTLQGELDWIVLRALEKDRNRRYESPNAFAEDIGCYLSDAPVLACPPSTLYWLRKVFTQHRGMIAVATSVLLALSVGLVLALWQANRAQENARQSAVHAHHATENANQERQAREQAQANLGMAIAAVEEMYQGLATRWLASDEGLSDLQQDYFHKALNFYGKLLDHPEQYNLSELQAAEMASRSAQLFRAMRDFAAARQRLEPATARFAASLAADPNSASDEALELLTDMHNMMGTLAELTGKYEEAKQSFLCAESVCEQLAARPSAETAALVKRASVANGLHTVYLRLGDAELAEQSLRRAITILDQLDLEKGDPHGYGFNELGYHGNLSALLRRKGQFGESEAVAQTAFDRTRRLLRQFPDMRPLREVETFLMKQLAHTLVVQDKYSEADSLLRDLRDRQVALLSIGTEPPNFIYAGLIDDSERFPGKEEPKKWSDWIRSTLMLAKIKYELGQPVAAENLLTSAAIPANFLAALYPNDSRHDVDLANLYAETACVLQPRYPAEAQDYAAYAANTWHSAITKSPDLETSLSDAHPTESDFQWFIKRFPEFDIRQLDVAERVAQITKSRTTPPRARALVMIDFEQWEEATRELTKALERHTPPEPYDLLTLSLVLAHLGQLDKARERFEEAQQLLEMNIAQDTLEPTVAQQRRQVAKLLKGEPGT